MPNTSIPGPHGTAANINAARQILHEPCGALDRLAVEHGLTSQISIGPLRLAIIGDADHAAQLFAHDTAAFRWGRVAQSLTVVIGKTSMIVSDGEDHRRRRSLVQPAFAKRRLDQWGTRIVAETDRFIDETISNTAPQAVDLHACHRKLVRRISVRVLFGDNLGARADEIGEMIEPAMQYAGQPAMRQLPHPFPFTFRARARAARHNVDELLDGIIAERRAVAFDPNSDSLVDALVHAEHEGKHLSNAEIRDQIITLIGAGYDTTSAVLSWTVARAALDPQCWTTLRTEAQLLLDQAAHTSDHKALRYATATVDEALRLHPAGPISPREVRRDIAIGPYTIAKGAVVAYSPHLIGRDARHWDAPLVFRPERFFASPLDGVTPENDAIRIDALRRRAWLPFGRGPRMCIGFALAQMQLVLITARMAQRLDIELTPHRLPDPSGMIVTRPSGGLHAVVRRFEPDGATRVN